MTLKQRSVTHGILKADLDLQNMLGIWTSHGTVDGQKGTVLDSVRHRALKPWVGGKKSCDY